ncbi:ArnT family glycosyltransferase [Hymenobacter mucosus]|uniref:4-amino-4-deoxy-L-arabinose transferase n=1 Tax=Hymenobacter mucosus TaxID=1411120 RepID=A0A238V8C6_9BACT|nr:glycosyltransferase family 39 protein [Hymenobacter mucosus]SNR29799.1 4-amino-4-deoxy-L-arabinose transferase [Hymenobacter mucosus]
MREQHVQPAGSTRRWRRLAAVLGMCGVSFFLHGGAPGVSLMESRNFVAAREMVAGGSWLIPTMNGELRLAKPPLPTWAVAGVQALTGPTDNLGLLRLPAALAATLLVLFLWGLARELTRGLPGEEHQPGRTAWVGALVAASSLLVITTGREGQWDIFANSLMLGGLWLLVRGWHRAENGTGWLAAAGVLGGLSILSKGPVALFAMLVPFVVSYLVYSPVHRQQARARWRGTVLAAGLMLGVGLSWPLYIWQHVAPTARAVARTEINSWGERHVQPAWFYWPFAAFTGVWALVAIASLVWPYARPRIQRYMPYLLALGWVLGGVVLLSLVPEKKERYMLPLMPPLALLVAGLLRYWEERTVQRSRADQWLIRGWGSLLLLVCVALPVAMGVVGFPGFGVGSVRFVVAVVVFAGVGWWILRRGLPAANPVVLTTASLLVVGGVLTLLMPIYPLWERRKDTVGLPHITDIRTRPNLRGLTWRSLDTLHVKQVWSAGRAVPIWHLPDTSATAVAPPQLPVVVFSASPIAARIPRAWRQRIQLSQLDSFYLGGKPENGYWYVATLSQRMK